MANYAIIEDGVVTNIILWDGNTKTYTPSGEAVLIPDGTDAQIGYTYASGTFTDPATDDDTTSSDTAGSATASTTTATTSST